MTPSRTSPVVSGTFATCWTASEETWSWPWRPTTRGKLSCRARAVAHGDHVADLQLATRPAAVFEPLFPFLQLGKGGEQPLLASDDAHLLPHQAPQRVEQFLHVQTIPAIVLRLVGRDILRDRRPALGAQVTGV